MAEETKCLMIPEGTTEVYGYKNSDYIEVVFPESVKKILEYAFMGCKIKKITFNDGIESILNFAFKDCENLEEVILPLNLTLLKANVFENCKSLKKVVFNKNLKTLDPRLIGHMQRIFAGCTNLQEVIFPESIDELNLEVFEESKIENLVLPAKIGRLYGNPTHESYVKNHKPIIVKKLNIPGCLKVVSEMLFYMIEGLEELVIEEGVQSIPNKTFNRKKFSPKKVVIPSTLTDADYFIRDCNSCGAQIEISPENPMYELDKGKIVKKGSTKKTSSSTAKKEKKVPVKITPKAALELLDEEKKIAIIPEGTVEIGKGAFKDITTLEKVVLPSTVTTIRDEAFENCTSLKEITFPDAPYTFESSTFKGCTSLETMDLTNQLDPCEPLSTLKNIRFSKYAKVVYIFEDYENVFIPESVTSIRWRSSGKNLKSFEISEKNETYKMIDGNLYENGMLDVQLTDLDKELEISYDDYLKASYSRVKSVRFTGQTDCFRTGAGMHENITFNDGVYELDIKSSENALLKKLVIPAGTKVLTCSCGSIETLELNGDFEKVLIYGCNKIKELIFKGFVKSANIHSNALLERIEFKGGAEDVEIVESELKSFTAPDSLKRLDITSGKMESIHLNDGLTFLSIRAKSLKDLTIPDTVKEIDYCMGSCFEHLDLGKGVEKINTVDPGHLKEFTIPGNVKSCKVISIPWVEKINIEDGIEEIGSLDGKLSNTTLTEVKFPASLRKMDQIYRFKNLTKIEFSEGLIEAPFIGLPNIDQDSVKFPSTVKKIRK